MNRDELIREYRTRAGSWPALLGVYAMIVGAMLWSASAII